MTEEFQSGMPRQLRNYWIHGEGAARIRWGTEGSFDRCVRALTEESHGTIRDPKGTCANLYHEATGKWPGAHRGEHGTEDIEVLVAAMGDWAPVPWRGPLAPIGTPTGDGRLFPPATITYQTFPMPLRWQEHGTRGHDGAITVAVIEGAAEGVDDEGNPAIMGHGYFLNPDIIPEVTRALHQVEHGVAGPSVDLDSYTARMVEYAGQTVAAVSSGRVRAATLVAVPAFANLRLQLNPQPVDEQILVEDLVQPQVSTENPLGDLIETDDEFAVNPTSWNKAPIAPREALFDADDAVKRIQDWSAGDPGKMSSVFLWIDPDRGGGAILGKEGYRLPWGDIVDGEPHVIYHAIYSAAALLEDAHGGLPNIPDEDKAKLRRVITDIYAKLAEKFDDPSMRASWDTPSEAATATTVQGAAMEEFTVRSGGWSDLPTSTGEWDEGAARAALDAWAGDDMGKYARGFLWFDAANRDLKTAYKFPIAKPVNGKLTIFLRAVNNADSRLNQANIPAADKAQIQGILNRIQARYHEGAEMSLAASAAPVHPPKSWFTKPPIGPTNKITVTDEGRVYGWAAPNGCHRGAMDATGTCVTPSAMARTVAHFTTGTTKTADGSLVDTGALVWDTTHAANHLRAPMAKRHYEDTGLAFADVTVGYDGSRPGGAFWFSGAMRPGTTEADWQKARQSPLSVDARRIGSDLALIDIAAVNRPGWPVLTAGLEGGKDTGVDVYFEDGVQMTLVASWTPEEFDMGEVAAAEPVTDEGCGCPDLAAKLNGYKPLLLPSELKARQDKLSEYGRI